MRNIVKVIMAFTVALLLALFAPGTAFAADCGTPAKEAVYKTVPIPGADEVSHMETVVVTPAVPGTPAVYEDVKVVDKEAVPPTPPVEEVSHIEHRLVTPAVDEVSHIEHRLVSAAVEEVSHIEHRLVTPGTPEVAEVSHQECDTLYHFAKFTQTREGKKVKGVIQWGEFGPWTKWSPETHTSWETNTNPLGSPAPHASGHDGNVYWERVWQARWDGGTKPVNCHKVIDVEYKPAVPPVYEDVKVIDVEAKDAVYEDVKVIDVEAKDAVYEDVKVIDVEAQPGTPGSEEVSHIEHRLVTPEVPGIPAVTREEKVVDKAAVPASSKKVLVSKSVLAGEVCAPPAQLAFTGSDARLPMLGLGLVLLGLISVGLSRFKKGSPTR